MGGEPRFVFGPVPSRRLGQSLGVDPLPAKTCNWNCVYCQLGRTTRMKLAQERAEYFPKGEIIREVRERSGKTPARRDRLGDFCRFRRTNTLQ